MNTYIGILFETRYAYIVYIFIIGLNSYSTLYRFILDYIIIYTGREVYNNNNYYYVVCEMSMIGWIHNLHANGYIYLYIYL